MCVCVCVVFKMYRLYAGGLCVGICSLSCSVDVLSLGNDLSRCSGGLCVGICSLSSSVCELYLSSLGNNLSKCILFRLEHL